MSTPRFLAEHNLRRAIVLSTRRQAPALVFTTAADLGLSATPDPDLLEFAFRNDWLLVSHDVTTLKPAAEARIRNGQGMAGLFLVPQDRPARIIAESLVLIWSPSQAEEWKDGIVYVPL